MTFRIDDALQEYQPDLSEPQNPASLQAALESTRTERAAEVEAAARAGRSAIDLGLRVFVGRAQSANAFGILVEGLESAGWRLDHFSSHADTSGGGGGSVGRDFVTSVSVTSGHVYVGLFRRA